MDHGNDFKPLSDETGMTQRKAFFGYQDYWTKVQHQFEKELGAIHELVVLGDEMIRKAENQATDSVQKVVCFLTRATMTGAIEALLLCGNGCGAGAMKIVRGMYESRWTAEYLRRHPNEVQDYLEFGKVIAWRRVRFSQEHFPGHITEEVERQAEDKFNKIKGRFTGQNGRLRQQWSNRPLRGIAEDIGCAKEYELPYSLACSIHHANFEGLLAHFDFNHEEALPAPPPSEAWIDKALLAAHENLYSAIDTLDKCCNLGFRQQLDGAGQRYIDVWSKRNLKSQD